MALRVAILGATGLIGREIAETLAEREFPIQEVFALASRKSLGKSVSMGDRTLRAQDADDFDWSRADVCFLAVGEKSARKWAARISAAGCVAIDVSPAFRSDPDVPMIAPEANPEAADGWRSRRILTIPGPSAAQLAAALMPIHRAVGVRRIVATVFSAASEQGRSAMDELWTQTKGLYVNQPAEATEFAKQIAFNVIPQVGDYLDDGSTDEETRLKDELKRLMGDDIEVASTAVHVPVFVGTAVAVHLELVQPMEARAARAMLREAPGLMVVDNREEEALVTPLECVGEWATFVSRIRNDDALPNGLAMWVVADNLRKGTALNAVQVAEALNARGAFAPRVED